MIIKGEESAFIAVDIQNDFCPGGALAVDDADRIIPIVNKLVNYFYKANSLCLASQDWHPEGHSSFVNEKAGTGIWPPHCVQCTPGSDFRPGLKTNFYQLVIRKGLRQEVDSYSVFFENDKTPTGLDSYLKGMNIKTVYFVGLALDYCVYYSAIDAASLGYDVYLIKDATKPVAEETEKKALLDMQNKGIKIISSGEILL